ncbi:MAG: type 1 glutamine amidotransferase [Halobacteria archaeon]
MILVIENEVDLEYRYLVDEIRRFLPESRVYDYAQKGGHPKVTDVDGVIIGGSTAGVYENDKYDWIEEEKALIRELAERDIPTLGICFGHQIVNSAFGGEVVDTGTRKAYLVNADFETDPIHSDVKPIVPVLHSDRVTERGEDLEVIGQSGYYNNFATKHEDAPLWSVQYHPEFTKRVEHKGDGWTRNELSFDDSNSPKTIKNFAEFAENY